MDTLLFNKLKIFKKRQKEIETLLTKNDTISNKKLFNSLSQENIKLNSIINYCNEWFKLKEKIISTKNIINDPELTNLVKEELKILYLSQEKIKQKIYNLILLEETKNEYGCFIEIRAGAGGSEASLFVEDLFKMYNNFAEIKNWKLNVINIHNNEYGGYKEIIIKISNKNSYDQLRFESGGHRVQRIPKTESQGRIHTSICTIAVIPVVPEKKIKEIKINDLRIDTFRSSGAGGQHVNTTNSAIRITHLPTGLVAECQDERSQHKNKNKALEVLGARLRNMEIQNEQNKTSLIRKNLLGSGDRSDRIRTYNFPKSRITDHRIGLTVHKLENIINGNLDILLKPIIEKYKFNKLNEFYS